MAMCSVTLCMQTASSLLTHPQISLLLYNFEIDPVAPFQGWRENTESGWRQHCKEPIRPCSLHGASMIVVSTPSVQREDCSRSSMPWRPSRCGIL